MSNALDAKKIYAELGGISDRVTVDVRGEVVSTNDVAKAEAKKGISSGYVVLADFQSGGRGRYGRPFYSPSGCGIYMSIVLRPGSIAITPLKLTVAASVAVSKVIEDHSSALPEIKWVNDILIDGKKVCGILSEGAFAAGEERLDYVVVGIGLNLYASECGFPPELENIAGYVLKIRRDGEREKIVADILKKLFEILDRNDSGLLYNEYSSRMRIIGKRATVKSGSSSFRAKILSLDESFNLIVQNENGDIVRLSDGEVSVRAEKQ